MSIAPAATSQRERELAAIISSYNEVTEKLKGAHERLGHEVCLLREELAEKNRELARKERLAALGEMAAGVAHEIRNPLGGIQLYASLLERDLAERPELKRIATKISSGVATLDGIVRDILAFAGGDVVKLTPTELAAVVEEALELAAPQQRALEAQVHVDLSACDVLVQGNPCQLERALLNLVFNALDAAGERGFVWIDCQTDSSGDYVELAVADDGPGVPPELSQRIFDPFFTSKDSGTGLGLAIVHRAAESHGGSVRVTARPGGGAVFTLCLRRAVLKSQTVLASGEI